MKAQLAEVVRGEFAMVFLLQGLFYPFQCWESVGIADKRFKKLFFKQLLVKYLSQRFQPIISWYKELVSW